MRTLTCLMILMLLGGGLAVVGHAQVPLPEMGALHATTMASLSQDIVVGVNEVNALAVSSGALTLTIDTATPGSPPQDAVDTSTTYSITTNGTDKKITGALDAGYASGITLTLELTAPTGGTATLRTLSTTAQDLVTGLSKVVGADLTLTYTASATLTTAPNVGSGGETNTVTLTLTDM
jgi:hypothetical protein